jgi:hypothetical protein
MNRWLKLSIAVNLVLTTLVLLLVFGQRSNQPAATITSFDSQPHADTGVSAQESVLSSASDSPNFRWSQLESTNYRTYMGNLRAIGCPERTLRDIIVADVDGLYASRRAELQHTFSHSEGQALAKALSQLQRDETAVLAALFGQQVGPVENALQNPVPVRTRRESVRDAMVTMPLVFQSVDPSTVNVTEQQAQIINELRQGFEDDLGGTSQDPNDPAYRERWKVAQRGSDEALMGALGRKFVDDFKEKAEETKSEP